MDSTAETISPAKRPFMKRIFVPSGTKRNIGFIRTLWVFLRRAATAGRREMYQREVISRTSTVAVNRVVMMPTQMVTAKPRTGGEPKMNSVTCASSVVTLTVDDGAVGALVAGLQGRQRLAAGLHLLAHALVDQHVGVHRHAEGEQDARHAGQRQRGAHDREDRQHDDQVHHQRDVREPAEQPVERRHEHQHQHEAGGEREGAGADRIGAELRPDALLLDDVERRGQGAGAQQQGEVGRRLRGEIAGDLPGAAGDRLTDDRRLDDLAVQDDGEGLADIGGGDIGEFARADAS